MNNQTLIAQTRIYAQGNTLKSLWHAFSTIVLFISSLVLTTIALIEKQYALYGLALIVTMVMISRGFMLLHDCSHESLFKSKWANHLLGYLLSLLFVSCFSNWRVRHLIHHATNGNLDKRGIGDVDFVTVDEYNNMNKREQFFYRFYRHPLVILGLGGLYEFYFKMRYLIKDDRFSALGNRYIKQDIILTNIVLFIIHGGYIILFGFKLYFLVYLMPTWIMFSFGVFLFYVQHNYPQVHFSHQDEWTYEQSGLQASSYLTLPRWLNWITASIGYHHVHHLNAKIPFYNLKSCHLALFRHHPSIARLNFTQAINCLNLSVYDRDKKRLVSIKEAKALGLVNSN